MSYIVFGLGNYGEEYEGTRHSVGRDALMYYWNHRDEFGDWKQDKKIPGQLAKATGGKSAATLVLYDGYMNNSGKALSTFVTSVKRAEKTIVLYDDIDLPLGAIRISFNRGDGGHNGVASVAKHLKTRGFVRIRIGVGPTNAKGVIKKPKDEEAFKKFLLSPFSPDEKKKLTKVYALVGEALDCLRTQKREKCMSTCSVSL